MMASRSLPRVVDCHPVTLASWLCALMIVLIASTMASPSLVVLGLHLPVLLVVSLVAAYVIPARVRAVVLLVCGPATALAFVLYPF